MNETFSEIYGFVPLTDKEKSDFAARYLPILDPKFIKVVEKDGQLIGFAIGMPDLSAGHKGLPGQAAAFRHSSGAQGIKKIKETDNDARRG
ncbi:MAG: hypothetical protein MZV63_31090 [Marinilabiliales bacterium]|nr:hypothetical protein [Marinilabiliales bacterium]